MKKNKIVNIILVFIFCLAMVGCTREFLNPYDRECPDDLWTPQNMSAARVDSDVLLTWEQPEEHFDGFLIERCLDSLTWEIVATVDCERRSYLDTSANNGKNYYRISAIADENQSGYCFVGIMPQDVGCQYGFFIDSRDGHNYKTIVIGTQTWMAENLAWLPSVSPPSKGSFSAPFYYVNDYYGTDVAEAKKSDYYCLYGALYNWPAALTSCPEGWHLPTDREWTILTDYLAANGYSYDGYGNELGKAIAATWAWTNSGLSGSIGNDLASNNSSCLSMLPGGYRYQDGTFYDWKQHGDWWTATEYDASCAYYRCMHFSFSEVKRRTDGFDKSTGTSVRCIKD